MQIQDLVRTALHPNCANSLRLQAETDLLRLFTQDTDSFLLACAGIIADQLKHHTARKITATVMKALLARKNNAEQWYWNEVGPDVRLQVKSVLLQTLISPDVELMRAGANAVALIAAIQISEDKWPQIVVLLTENAMSPDPSIKMASVTTLSVKINKETCEQILGSLLLGTGEDQSEILQIYLSSLRNSVQFLKEVLETQSYCNKTMQILFSLLSKDTNHKVYQILFELGKHCYHLLDDYVDNIVQFSVKHLQDRNDNAIHSLELWDTIGTEFLERQEQRKSRVVAQSHPLKNILELAHRDLLPEIMTCILILDQQDLPLVQLRQSAVKTLATFVECGSSQIATKVIEAAARIFESSNPGERQASALYFSCLCQYRDKGYIAECFKNGFPYLFTLLSDRDPIVRKNTLNGFVPLSETFGAIFLDSSHIQQVFSLLVEQSQRQDEDICILSLIILGNLTDLLTTNHNPIRNQSENYLRDLVALFEQNLKHRQVNEVNEKLIWVIINLIINTDNPSVVRQLTSHLIDLYSYSTIRITDKQIVLDQLITLLHTTVLTLAKFNDSNSELKTCLFQVVQRHINSYGVETESINMIGALALSFPNDFVTNLEFYWNLLTGALQNIQQKPLFKAALACIEDLSRIYSEEIADKIIAVFNRLLNYMYADIDRQIKIDILRSFGDLQLGLKKYGGMFVDRILTITKDCCEATYKYLEIEDEWQYAEELKTALLEMHHSLLFAINSHDHFNPLLANNFCHLANFIVRTCDLRYRPTVDYLKNSIYFIYDYALLFEGSEHERQISRIAQSKEVDNIVEQMKKYSNEEEIIDILVFVESNKLKHKR